MGHNMSDFKRQRLMLAAPLADWCGWSLVLDCGGQRCPRRRVFEVDDLARAHPALPLVDYLNRMRCNSCSCGGEVRDAVMLRLRAEQRVVVRGTGG